MKPASVLGQFLATAERHGLLPAGVRVLAAVSGGADSVCMLDLLRVVAPGRRLQLHAFHMNHRLRPGAKRDEAFTRRLCAGWRVPLSVVGSDVAGFARRHKVGVEEAGRQLRYRHLDRLARRLGCDRISLGHTADDSLETMLLSVARGAALHGLAGIRPRRGRVIRPLIEIERRDIVRYLTARGVGWVEDETNASEQYRRNLVRHRVVAALRQVNPRLVANAGRTARLVGAEDDYLDSLAARALDDVAMERRGRVCVDASRFAVYNTVLKRRMMKQLIPELDADGVERAVEFCTHGSRPMLQLRKRVRLVRWNETVELVRS